MAVNKIKQKRRLRKSIAQRKKEVQRVKLATAWRNIFVASGILKRKRGGVYEAS